MPHLVQMDKKLRKKGLVIIGAERQNSTAEAIKKVAGNAKAQFTFTKGVNGPETSTTGIPRALIFDASGKLIFTGRSSDDDFERTIKKALKDVKLEDDEPKKVMKSKKPLIAQRTWKNSEGKSITASVTKVDGEEVTFKFRNLKVVKYQLSKLSEPDQKLIKLAVETAASEKKEDE